VVDICELGGSIAAGKPTRQIPAADEPLQLGRWAVIPLGWAISGMTQRLDLPKADVDRVKKPPGELLQKDG
jgi:hypothetical protein